LLEALTLEALALEALALEALAVFVCPETDRVSGPNFD
jgi:hypothetical protein